MVSGVERVLGADQCDQPDAAEASPGRKTEDNPFHVQAKSRRLAFRIASVTRSYWPGLFRCSDVAGLPRTNNDLEQFFGLYRYHERRASGAEGGLPGHGGAGVSGLVAAAATRLRSIEVADLVPSDLAAWEDLRGCWNGGERFGRWDVASDTTPRPTSDRLKNH